jgi:hypothetical protein
MAGMERSSGLNYCLTAATGRESTVRLGLDEVRGVVGQAIASTA